MPYTQDMTRRTVATVYPDRESAERAFDALQSASVPHGAMSLLTSQETLQSLTSMDQKRVESGTAAGAGAGTILSSLAVVASLPLAGSFFAAGPFGALMAGAASGAVTSGSIGALIGLGFDEPTAKGFEDRIKEGGVGVAVETETKDEAERIKKLLSEAGDDRARELLITTKPRP